VLASLAAFAGHAAVVYKWTDSDGVVHYSDQSVPGAEKIFTATSAPAGTVLPGATADARAPGKTDGSPLGYTQFSITSPTADQTFFGDEIVTVNLALSPALKADQSITWHLSGRQLDQPPTSVHFALPHMDRGTYIIAATITDQESGESRTTDSVTFFVRQPSELSPQHR
jgi:Domain of unknown function (DUF4124)